MKNFFAKTYKIKCDDVIYLNFQFTCLVLSGIFKKGLSSALKEKMLRDFDLKPYLALWDQIDTKDDIREKTGSSEVLELEVTEKEICSYLRLAIFVSKIADSKYFIFMKDFLTAWEEMLSRDLDMESKALFKNELTLEGFSESFARDVKIIARLAAIRFRDKPAFTRQIESAFNYKLS